MHLATFAERARLAHEHLVPLAQGAVEGLHEAGAAAALRTAEVLPTGQSAHVGVPEVGEVPAARPAPVGGQLVPQALRRGPAAVAQHPGHDAPAGPLNGQPEPHFLLPGPHKRPHLVQLQRRPTLSLSFLGPQARRRGRSRQGFFLAAASPAPRPWPARCCAGSCAPRAAYPRVWGRFYSWPVAPQQSRLRFKQSPNLILFSLLFLI